MTNEEDDEKEENYNEGDSARLSSTSSNTSVVALEK